MNIFYASPEQISTNHIELSGEEAKHAAKVLRYQQGDSITVVDGEGGWYEGRVSRILRDAMHIEVDSKTDRKKPAPDRTIAMGIIKKRDRLEFAVEKAVELGASEIVLFRGEHSVKQNVRGDRLQSTVLAAMKQSLRAWLPEVTVCSSLKEVLQRFGNKKILVARQSEEGPIGIPDPLKEPFDLLLTVGPEGGLSEDEISLLKRHEATYVSLGKNRLRTETAVVAFLSQFIDAF